MSRTRRAVVLGLLIGLLGAVASVLPPVMRIEEVGGLSWLFLLRGVRPPPPGIYIVSIDLVAGESLGLPADPARWPRALHAQLVRRLHAAGARVIAYDVFFGAPGEATGDATFADALHEAGNVILTAQLDKQFLPLGRADVATRPAAMRVRLDPPIEVLGHAALATVPFALPVWPTRISQFWVFHDGAGGWPSLPTAVAQASAMPALATFAALVEGKMTGLADRAAAPADLAAFMQRTRDRFLADPALPRAVQAQLDGAAARGVALPAAGTLAMLLRLYAGPSSHYLNFYGPPHTVPGIAFTDVIGEGPLRTRDGATVDLRDAIVFVGFAARVQPEQRDGFLTAFSQDTGLNLSGVEIAATATANLLENRPLHPLAPLHALGLVFLFGMLVGISCRALRGLSAVGAGVAGALLWLAGALTAFTSADLWAPLIVPLFFQVPLALIGGLLLQFRQVRGERARMNTALGRYVPPPLIERLVEEGVEAGALADVVHGTCMATDAARYTALAETMDPDALGRLINAYYDILFAGVERGGGQVSDVVGDAMMAIWASSRRDARIQAQACRAALCIDADLVRRIDAGECAALPTRIGLHAGQVRLGHVGARQHLEYRAVGDIVNTASRIEGLNKWLGTRVLASQAALDGVDVVWHREVGTFILPGKHTPIVIHELTGLVAVPDGATGGHHGEDEFAAGLAAFRAGCWAEAARCFGERLRREPDDGPARYYLGLCSRYLAAGPRSFRDGAVCIEGK